jgi:hypothetical protein
VYLIQDKQWFASTTDTKQNNQSRQNPTENIFPDPEKKKASNSTFQFLKDVN